MVEIRINFAMGKNEGLKLLRNLQELMQNLRIQKIYSKNTQKDMMNILQIIGNSMIKKHL